MLQKINDLEVIAPSGEVRALGDEEREKVLEAMGRHANMSFNGLRKVLEKVAGHQLPGNQWEQGRWENDQWVKDKKGKEWRLIERGWTFNFEPQHEKGGKEELPGNRTMARLRPIFPHWKQLGKETRDEIIFTLCAAENDEAIERAALRKKEEWGLDGDGAKALSKVRLEDGRAAFSRPALEKMVEKMKEKVVVEGVERYRRYQEARREAYPDVPQAPVEDLLPPLLLSAPDPRDPKKRVLDPRVAVRNPAVIRVLTEMRKVVNALIRRYGKPRLIRIESGKELRKGRKEREEIWKKNQQRRREVDGIVQAAGGDPKNPYDREKILLADECGWLCPYSGATITPHKLYALQEFAVEHIIPLSRSRDNTLRNKTLCRPKENQEKNNRTPWEAFHADSQRWHDMVERVRRFRGSGAQAKLRLFMMEPEDVKKEYDDFTRRHLQDMQFASKAARRYLSLLFEEEGRSDDGFSPKVQAVAGGMTAHLRRAWDLEKVMPTLANLPKVPPGTREGEKYRFDHRHHALDAAVIAMTTGGQIKRLADEIRRIEERRSFAEPVRLNRAKTLAPLADCAGILKRELEKVIVSHREGRGIGGKLHDNLPVPMARRKPLSHCRREDIENIVDERVREIVRQKLKALGIEDPRRAFSRVENHPYLESADGRKMPIHRVRVKVPSKAKAIGRQVKGVDERLVNFEE